MPVCGPADDNDFHSCPAFAVLMLMCCSARVGSPGLLPGSRATQTSALNLGDLCLAKTGRRDKASHSSREDEQELLMALCMPEQQ